MLIHLHYWHKYIFFSYFMPTCNHELKYDMLFVPVIISLFLCKFCSWSSCWMKLRTIWTWLRGRHRLKGRNYLWWVAAPSGQEGLLQDVDMGWIQYVWVTSGVECVSWCAHMCAENPVPVPGQRAAERDDGASSERGQDRGPTEWPNRARGLSGRRSGCNNNAGGNPC